MSTEPKKVVTIGDMGVGKTSIINAIRGEDFSTDVLSTIGASYVQCSFPVGERTVTLNIWDTAGQERFQSLIPLYLRNADACIIVFDITRENSLEMLDTIYDNLRAGPDQPAFCILCANKMDLLKEKISTQCFEEWASEKHMEYLPTSAKTGLNIDILFNRIATKVSEVTQIKELKPLQIQNQSQKQGCCRN